MKINFAGALRGLRFWKKAPSEDLLDALTDRQLLEIIVRQTADAAARLAILLGEQAPPRGFNPGKIGGPKRALVRSAKESLGQCLEGLGALGRRIK